MEFVLIAILILIFFNPTSSDDKKKNRDEFYYDDFDIDPCDTFHLEDGLDHETDDDGYCEECDDYHDA